jgi:hypothetical protein
MGEKVPLGTLGYFRARNKRHAYDLVVREFKRSGISQAELARRLGKGTDRVCKLIGGPGNWTLDTVSDLLFAIGAAEPVYGLSYPLDKPTRNYSAEADLLEKFQTESKNAINVSSIDKGRLHEDEEKGALGTNHFIEEAQTDNVLIKKELEYTG